MKNKLKTLFTAAVAAAMTFGLYAEIDWESSGSHSIGKTATYTVPAGGDVYYKVAFSTSMNYTIVAQDQSAQPVSGDLSLELVYVYVNPDDEEKEEYCDTLDYYATEDSRTTGSMRLQVYGSDLDIGEGYTLKGWYLKLSNAKSSAMTVKVTSSTGIIDEEIPEGDPENPKKVTVSERETTSSGDVSKVMDGEYCFDVYGVEYGKRYRIWTEGGSASYPTELSVATTDVDVQEGDFAGEYDVAVVVTPQEGYDDSEPYSVMVSGCANRFTLHLVELPSRLPSAHALAGTLGAPGADGVSSDCMPGRAISAGSSYYDVVIDEELFSVTLAKGSRYAFRTTGVGAADPIKIQLCDASGEEVAARRGTGDQLIVYEVPSTAKTLTYYVGVCQDVAEDEEIASVSCSVEAVLLTPAAATLLDDFDNGDDVCSGATGLDFAPDEETASAEHTLGLTDWEDWFRVDARSGIAYAFRGEWTVDAEKPVRLLADIYKANGTALGVNVKEGISFTNGYEIAASKKNESYLVRVYLEDSAGYDAGPYVVKSSVSASTGVGSLKVNLLGPTGDAKAYWQLKTDGTSGLKYTDGSTVMLAAGSHELTFGTPTGWSAIGNQEAEVTANEANEVTFRYSDTSSPKDDTISGATQISFKSAAQSVDRSLWGTDGDLADWFKFTGDAGTYYSIAITYRGDATSFTLCDATGKTLVESGEAGAVLWSCPTKGTYTVKVVNGGEDSLYTLAYSSAKVGAVKLDKSAYTVANNAASLAIKVKRTQNEGRVRVRYTTVAGEGEDGAQPGVHYDAATGVLEWADGDKADKTVTVKLIPDLNNKFRGDKTLGFALSTVPAEELESGEWIPNLDSPSVATIKIQEKNKLVPGTVKFAGYEMNGAVYAFADAKKPTLSVDPGVTVTLLFDRTGGTDGAIAVKAEAVKGKALPTVDYEALPTDTYLMWSDGDDSQQSVDISLVDQKNRTAKKTFTVKLTAQGTGTSKPTLYATAATITINVNDTTPQKAKDLPLAVNPAPADSKGLVGFGGAEEGVVPLSWTGTDDCYYRVSVADNKNKLDDENYGNRFFIDAGTDWQAFVDGLAAGKTWYWRVDTVYYTDDGDEFVNKNTKVWSFKTAQDVAQTTVCDSNGDPVDEGSTMTLRAGIQTSFAVGSPDADEDDTVKYAVVGGKLPDGLKLDAKTGLVTGVPTKAGTFSAAFQSTLGKTGAATVTINFEVLSAGVAVGTFKGIGTADEKSASPDLTDFGLADVTVDAKGGITAKLTFGATAYTFKRSGTTAGFDAYDETCSDLSGVEGYTVVIDAITKATKTTPAVTNTLALAVPCGAENDAEALSQPAAWTLTLCAGSEDEKIIRGTAVRDSKKIAAVATALAAWEGYYTVSLPPVSAGDGEPQGAGYLTVTIDAKGGVKVGGASADGVTLTAATVLGFTDCTGDTESGLTVDQLVIPVYVGKKTSGLGGYLKFMRVEAEGESVAVADPAETLRWISSDVKSTRSGLAGFDLTLEPTGGWFDKLQNLSAYYLNTSIAFDVGTFATDEADMLAPSGYGTLLAYPGSFDTPLEVSSAGNALSVVKKALVKKDGSKTLYDLESSDNASNVSLKFTRATGVFSGTFSLWYGDAAYGSESKQKELSGIKYAGVLTPCKYAGDYFTDPGLGYINATETILSRKWTGSWLLRLAGTDVTEENEARWEGEGWSDGAE